MLPWSFSEDAAAEKYMPQLQHNMRVGPTLWRHCSFLANFVPQPAIIHYIWVRLDIWVCLAAGRSRPPGRPPDSPLGRSSMFRRGKSNPNSPGRVIVNKANPSLLEG